MKGVQKNIFYYKTWNIFQQNHQSVNELNSTNSKRQQKLSQLKLIYGFVIESSTNDIRRVFSEKLFRPPFHHNRLLDFSIFEILPPSSSSIFPLIPMMNDDGSVPPTSAVSDKSNKLFNLNVGQWSLKSMFGFFLLFFFQLLKQHEDDVERISSVAHDGACRRVSLDRSANWRWSKENWIEAIIEAKALYHLSSRFLVLSCRLHDDRRLRQPSVLDFQLGSELWVCLQSPDEQLGILESAAECVGLAVLRSWPGRLGRSGRDDHDDDSSAWDNSRPWWSSRRAQLPTNGASGTTARSSSTQILRLPPAKLRDEADDAAALSPWRLQEHRRHDR